MTLENLTALFKALDTDGSKTLDLKEFTRILGYMDNKNKKKLQNIDSDTLATLNL